MEEISRESRGSDVIGNEGFYADEIACFESVIDVGRERGLTSRGCGCQWTLIECS